MNAPEAQFQPGSVPLDCVIATSELDTRPTRAPDYSIEVQALRELSRKLGEGPRAALQCLVDQAVRLCRAGSAGISIAETADGNDVFRWHAVAGQLSPFLHATLPRWFSPCGEVLGRRATILMRGMIGHYPYVGGLGLPLPEVLLVPFFEDERPVGTIWVAHHDDSRFDREDLRLLLSLSEATTGIVRSFRSYERLEESVAEHSRERELRQRLIDTITHDLRTPLTAARLSAQMVQRKVADPAVQKNLDRIIFNMDRAERMIRDMLDANLVKAGEKLPLLLSDCDAGEVVQNTVRDLADLHGDRFQVSAPGAIRGRWDAGGLQRIVENLGSNAVKYGNADGAIRVALEVHDNELRLEVHNEGKPIAPEEQEKIFRPYRRAESAMKGSQKGWGLGLSLVKGLSEAHGGGVTVRSLEGEGTTFTVRLPSAAGVALQQ